jgi:hypothetical protein
MIKPLVFALSMIFTTVALAEALVESLPASTFR